MTCKYRNATKNNSRGRNAECLKAGVAGEDGEHSQAAIRHLDHAVKEADGGVMRMIKETII